jgi:hypothetical protein
MMNVIFEDIIKKKIDLLVDFIIEKNSNVIKEHIYHKIYQLNILSKPRSSDGGKKSIVTSQHPTAASMIENQRLLIKVRRSEHSNYVLYPPSHVRFDDLVENKLVMNINNRTIIGIENSKGEIEPLNKNLIEICHKYKLKFEIPLNLNVEDDETSDVIDADEIRKLGLSYKIEEDEDEDEEEND